MVTYHEVINLIPQNSTKPDECKNFLIRFYFDTFYFRHFSQWDLILVGKVLKFLLLLILWNRLFQHVSYLCQNYNLWKYKEVGFTFHIHIINREIESNYFVLIFVWSNTSFSYININECEIQLPLLFIISFSNHLCP